MRFTLAALTPVFADVARISSPDFEHTSAPVTAAVGLCLAATVIFAGAWGVRHPRAFVGLMLAVPAAVLACIGVAVLTDGAIGGLICLVPGLAGLGLGVWLMAQKSAFTGRSLMYLLLAATAAAGGVIAFNHVTWQRPVSPRPPSFQLQDQPATPTTTAKPTE